MSHAIAIVYDYGQTGFQKFGSSKEQEYGAVTAIDLAAKDDSLACGYESGHITIWNIVKNELVKTIAPTEASAVLSIRFWKEIRTHIIAGNSKGFVHLYKLESLLFQLIVDKKVLLNPPEEKKDQKQEDSTPSKLSANGFFAIEILKKDLFEDENLSRYSLVALVSMQVVLVVALEPTIAKVFKYERAPEIPPANVPSITWTKGCILRLRRQQIPFVCSLLG